MKHSSYHVEQPDFKNTRALTWKYMKLFMDMGLKNSPVALVGLRDRPQRSSADHGLNVLLELVNVLLPLSNVRIGPLI